MIKWIAQFIVALAFIASPALADGHLFPQRFDVANVASNDTLNIRAQPTGKSNILGELAYDAKGVEVIRKDASGKWGQVNAGEGAGWVSLAYMRVTNDPHWAEMVEPLLCSGTEPFWNLALTPRAGTKFKVIEGLDLRASVGNYLRVPSLFELFGDRAGADYAANIGRHHDWVVVFLRLDLVEQDR